MKANVQRLSESIGVPRETIRHYRETGVVLPTVEENGYYSYSQNDALAIMLTREMRSYGMPVEAIREAYAHYGIDGYNRFLQEREADLQQQLEHIQLELLRMRETRTYAGCGLRLVGQVEEFDGPPTWAVVCGNEQAGFVRNHIDEWNRHFPFTYVSATVPLPELQQKTGARPYAVRLGYGALIHYVERFRLPLHDGAFFQPGGHFIRTVIPTRDVMTLCPDDLRILYRYADAHGYVFASCTGGRLLFIQGTGDVPMHYFLVWVRVDPKG